MKKINTKDKASIKAGSAWTTMMGVSVLGGVANSIVNTVLGYTIKDESNSSNSTQGSKKQSTYIRLSPYPNRTTVGLYI